MEATIHQDEPARELPYLGVVRNIAIKDLVVPPPEESQREFNPRWAAHLAKQFDPVALGVLYVGKRPDGTFVVLDGQHRIGAATLHYGADAAPNVQLPCMVIPVESVAEEAMLFRRFNDALNMPAHVKFHKALIFGDAEAVAIEEIVTNAGFKLHLHSSPTPRGHVKAINGLLSVYRQAGKRSGMYQNVMPGPQLLATILALLAEAHGIDSIVSIDLMQGLQAFLNRYSGHERFRRARLVDVLRASDWEGLRAEAAAFGKTVRVTHRGYRTAMLLLVRYNHRLPEHTRLPSWS